MNPDIRRCRFIAPTADLSALGGRSDVRIKKLLCIIGHGLAQIHISQTFGDNACHPERSEGSGSTDAEMLRCAQHDSEDTGQVRSRGKSSLPISAYLTSHLTYVKKYEII